MDVAERSIDRPCMAIRLQTAFGERLRGLRQASGTSQEAFASLADIDRASYGKLERGELNPSLITLARLAVALGLTLSQLLEGLETPASEIRSLPRSTRGRRSS